MRATGFCHHIGTLLIFAAAVLMMITSISTPVVDNITLLTVNLNNGSDIQLGVWGYCITNVNANFNGGDTTYCTGHQVGYDLVSEVNAATGLDLSGTTADTADNLTNGFVVHPVVAGLALISFFFVLGAGIMGGLLSALLTAMTWILAVILVAFDFATFAYIKSHVEDDTSNTASYGVGIWCCTVSMICLFLGFFWVLFTCCSARRREKRVAAKV